MSIKALITAVLVVVAWVMPANATTFTPPELGPSSAELVLSDVIPGTERATIDVVMAIDTDLPDCVGFSGYCGTVIQAGGSIGPDFLDIPNIMIPTYSPNVVPIPAALPLLASGLGAFGFMGWRRNRKTAVAA